MAEIPVAKKLRLEESEDEILFSDCSTCSLEIIRQKQAKFCKDRNWDQYHTPRNVLLAMVGEVGEVAELFQWKGEVKEGLPDWSEEEKTHLSHELSDVLVYLVRLADRCNIDLPAAVMEKFELNAQKYPAKMVFGSSKKYTKYPQNSKEISAKKRDKSVKKSDTSIKSKTNGPKMNKSERQCLESVSKDESNVKETVISTEACSPGKKAQKCLKNKADSSNLKDESNNKESATLSEGNSGKKAQKRSKKKDESNNSKDEYSDIESVIVISSEVYSGKKAQKRLKSKDNSSKKPVEKSQWDIGSSLAVSEINIQEKKNSDTDKICSSPTKKSEKQLKSNTKKTNKDSEKAGVHKKLVSKKKSDNSLENNSFSLKVDVHNSNDGNISKALNPCDFLHDERMKNIHESPSQLRVLIKKCDDYLESDNVSVGISNALSKDNFDSDRNSSPSRSKHPKQRSLFEI